MAEEKTAEERFWADLGYMQSNIEQPRLNKVNPHFKNRYADLTECWRVVREVKPIGMFINHDIKDGNVWTVVRNHEFEAWMSPVPVSMNGKPQDRGSELTYAKRYSLCMAFGLSADEDDDGNAASQAQKQPSKAVQKPDPVSIAKSELVRACEGYAKRFGIDSKTIMAQVAERPDYPSDGNGIADWYLKVAAELDKQEPAIIEDGEAYADGI